MRILSAVVLLALAAGCSRAAPTASHESAPPAPATAVASAVAVAPPPPPGEAYGAAPEAARDERSVPPSAPAARKTEAFGPMGGTVVPGPFAAGAASVKAGEWDDNANFRDFRSFLASAPGNLQRDDLSGRHFLVVRDRSGRPVPRCKIDIRDEQQRTTSLVTTASGRAILFPRAEGLAGSKLVATTSCSGGSAERSFALDGDRDGIVDLRLPGDRGDLGARTVDLAFVLDTTGSMSQEIEAVKATIQKVAGALAKEQVGVRVGLVEYKDRSDSLVTKTYPFATDLNAFARQVSGLSAGGGGDTPEDMNAGLHAAMTELAWGDRSIARLAFVIADAPPHLDYQGPRYGDDTKSAAHRGIQLFTVAASGMDLTGQAVFRQMAQYTGGTELFVVRGGTSPSARGGGDPASSCGGTHTNYASGNLDDLVVQKVRRELRALEADPMRIAGLNEDENAKPCDQRVVFKD